MVVAHLTPRLPLAVIISLLLLCVFSGAAAAASPRTEIKALFSSSANESAVRQCSTAETQRFREQTTDTPGKRALAVCERDARLSEERAAVAVVSHIAVRGRTATLHLKPFGTNLEGQILRIRLIRFAGRWKADEILGFFHLDRDKLIEVFKEKFSSPGSHVPVKVASCIYGRLRHASAAEITGYLFSGSPEGFNELYDPCLPDIVKTPAS